MKCRSRRRRGYALMLVILEVVLITSLWGVASRQLASTMQLVMYFKRQGQGGSPTTNDAYKPMARALSLLETGEPRYNGQVVDAFTCNATILTSSGPRFFTITYTKGSSGTGTDGSPDESWTVTTTQQYPDPEGQPTWDNMPSNFGY